MIEKQTQILLCILISGAIVFPPAIAVENEYIDFTPNSTLVPDLVYYPTSHDFGDVIEGQTYQTTFQIWNGGTGTLTWNLGIVHTWISPSPTSGSSTGVSEKDTITVTIDTTGMSLGPHSGFVSISANDGGGVRYFNIDLNIVDNNPPNTPSKLVGPSSGRIGETLTYTSSTIDPDGNPIQYGVDFHNDGTVDSWGDFYPSGAPINFFITINTAGTYQICLKARDIYGAESGWSDPKIVIITDNDPPNTPNKPFGPSSGTPGKPYTFSTHATDPEGDLIRYGWDWDGDDSIDEWTDFYTSGTEVSSPHIWTTEGTYSIKVIAEDEHGAQSSFSISKQVSITENNPPNKPQTPSGETQGKTGTSYSYSSVTTDPESNRVYYLFDWGDGTDSGWIGPYDSGDTVSLSHSWDVQGSYPIKVKAKDDPDGNGDLSDGIESVWSDPLSVSMPKGKAAAAQSFQMIFEKLFLQRYTPFTKLFNL